MKNAFEIIIKKSKKTKIKAFYEKAMKELIDFYEINWTDNTPIIYLADSREAFDTIGKEKTEQWVVGKALDYNKLLLMSPDTYEKESCHKYSDELYYILIKHELSHLFYDILSQNKGPVWLEEGMALYVSGELPYKKAPKKFSNFLRYYDFEDADVYSESGFVIEKLIKKFGKDKILNFIKLLPNIHDEKQFEDEFKNLFKIDLGYKQISNL